MQLALESRPSRRRRFASSRAAFTILEILIAIVVLVLGITGIIALFPTAIESGNKTVEDSYAAAITQSVVDAIAVGVRESRYTYRTAAGRTYTYFVFNHDGVIEQPPLDPANFERASWDGDTGDGINDKSQGSIWRRDYCVILPTAAANNAALANEPNFIYPVPSYVQDDATESAKDNDQYGLMQRSPTRLNANTLTDNLHIDFLRPSSTIGQQVPWVSRVYHLGRYRQPLGSSNGGTALPNGPDGSPMKAGEVRIDYLGDAVQSSGTGRERTVALDPYPNYSFSFTLQRARIDTTGGPGNVPDGKLTAGQDLFSDTLYTLRVRIYKNFDKEAAFELKPGNVADQSSPPTGSVQSVPRSNIHIREFVTLIAL
jgi:type II secretory pathway pseudopilin PulG